MNIQSGLQSAQPVSRETTVAKSGGAGGNASASAATKQPSSPAEDTASISRAGQSAAAVSSVSDVRLEKVAAVQRGLADGSYAVSPSDVAGKLIDHLLQN